MAFLESASVLHGAGVTPFQIFFPKCYLAHHQNNNFCVITHLRIILCFDLQVDFSIPGLKAGFAEPGSYTMKFLSQP